MAYVYATTRTWILVVTALCATAYAVYFTWINPLRNQRPMPKVISVKIVK